MAKTRYCRIGTKVEARDVRSQQHGRSPDRPEGAGIIADLFSPYGRSTRGKDKKPPYFVKFSDGRTAWYEADEIKPRKGSC